MDTWKLTVGCLKGWALRLCPEPVRHFRPVCIIRVRPKIPALTNPTSRRSLYFVSDRMTHGCQSAFKYCGPNDIVSIEIHSITMNPSARLLVPCG